MVWTDGPMSGITKYLGRRLSHLIDRVIGCSHGHDLNHVLHHLKTYQKNRCLHYHTRFASFSINELCQTFSHDAVLVALEKFLHDYASESLFDGMTIKTIIDLVQLVLNNQYFLYQKRLYRQMAGGASGYTLTIPLAYIYLFDRHRSFFDSLKNDEEIFVR